MPRALSLSAVMFSHNIYYCPLVETIFWFGLFIVTSNTEVGEYTHSYMQYYPKTDIFPWIWSIRSLEKNTIIGMLGKPSDF